MPNVKLVELNTNYEFSSYDEKVSWIEKVIDNLHWEEITHEEYELLCQYIAHTHGKNYVLVVHKAADKVLPSAKELANKLKIEKEKEEKKREEAARKRLLKKAEKKKLAKEQELKLLEELKAKYPDKI